MARETVAEEPDPGGGTYRLELVRCGKPACNSCPHGPYWYRYYRVGKRVVSKYVGRDRAGATTTRRGSSGATAPGGADQVAAAPAADPASERQPAAAPAEADPPGRVQEYRNPATAAEDAAMRQAVENADYDTAVKHLQRMDRLEKQAGAGEGEGMRPKIAVTVTMMKAVKSGKQREARELPKRRERQAGEIAATASQVITEPARYTKTTPEQADRVKTSLGSAADSLRAGDHEGALSHLAEAREAAKGPEGTSVLTSGRDGRGAVYRIADHEMFVQVLADKAESLARYAPPAPKAAKEERGR